MNRNDGDGTGQDDGRSDYETHTDIEAVTDTRTERAEDSELRRGRRRESHPSTETVDEIVDSFGGKSVTVTTKSITATLVGIPEIELREYVYDHQLTVDHEPDERRPVVMFDLENTGNYPVTWRSSRTRFIGTDGYTYRPAQLSLDPSRLGPGCHTRQVEIEPNRRARVLTLVEELPAGVDVAEVIHKITPLGESQRLAFAVE